MFTIEGIELEILPELKGKYRNRYWDIAKDISDGVINGIEACRWLILNDLFFIVYFVLGEGKINYKKINHLFVIDACNEVQNGPKTNTLDIWAREHLKSSIITIGETIQYVLGNPESSTCIFSYARPVAKKFLFELKMLFENSTLLKKCFPELLTDIEKRSPVWSLDDGLILLGRKGNRKEPTIYASGLVEGMPTGMHFDRMVFDDLVTEDMAQSYEVMEKVKIKFDSAQNLGMDGGVHRVVGTFYHHNDPLVEIKDKKDIEGRPLYVFRLKPATKSGLGNDEPVFLSKERFEYLKTTKTFNCQQLLNPTPQGDQKLNAEFLQEVDRNLIPSDCYKFMVIDPAGDSENKKGDSWAIHVVGVEPKSDELGISKIYIMDSFINPMSESEAVEQITRMYLNNGMIMQLGYERMMNTTPAWLSHVLNGLRKKGRYLSEDSKTLIPLSHGGRNKVHRIISALQWALNNSCIFISKGVSNVYRERLREEMNKFPYWHDDGLDALSYVYDMIKDFNFVNRRDDYIIPEYEPVNQTIGY